MKELEIILTKQEDGSWEADTNLPGMPPVRQDKDWQVALGLLVERLHWERETWSKYVHLPKLTIKQKEQP